MDTVDLVHRTNGTFTQQFVMDAWADLYDFTAGHWHSHLRRQIESTVALYEWSTENGNITYEETNAHGEIAFTINPSIGDVLRIGNTQFVFGASDGIMIGTDLSETMYNIVTFLRASSDLDVVRCDYGIVSGGDVEVLVITYRTAGMLGNSFPFDTNVAGNAVSGETLMGGGGLLTMTAPVDDLTRFIGIYFYDVRFQSDAGPMTPIVGGQITFEEGVTRDTIEPVSETV